MKDSNLEFLKDCSNEQLKTLVDILVFDKNGKKRYTESLSATKKFAECYPNNLKSLVPEIINEFQRFGGNSIANWLRGHGVPYREILVDVCGVLKVDFNKNASTETIEGALLRTIAINTISKMSDSDIESMGNNLTRDELTKAIYSGGGPIMTFFTSLIVATLTRQVGAQGFKLFGRSLLSRAAVAAVPFLNAIAGIWTIADITSPAYRVTIPFTVTVAFIRFQMNASEEQFV